MTLVYPELGILLHDQIPRLQKQLLGFYVERQKESACKTRTAIRSDNNSSLRL